MQMRTFLIYLQNELKKSFPDVDIGFYILRRSRYAHMGSDVPLNRIPNHEAFVETIKKLWYEKKTDDKFHICDPYLISSMRWKYDYIIFRKNYYNDILTNENLLSS